MNVKPGQIEPNELEISILEHLTRDESSISKFIGHLRVLSRQYTGVGCYVNFDSQLAEPELGEKSVPLHALIELPNVPNGMGAILCCESGKPKCLEIYSYGDDYWDGTFDGFKISQSV